MWAKDKVCFQHLVLNEMRQNTNTDRWIAGMIGTETEVARSAHNRSMDAKKRRVRSRPRKKERNSTPLSHGHQESITTVPGILEGM